MTTTEQIRDWRGRQLVDRDGQKVGKIEEIYLDTTTDAPVWALVNTGLFGTKSTFVPLHDARLEGDAVRVSHEKAHIKDAPGVETDGELSETEEASLYRHYGRDYTGSADSDVANIGGTRDVDTAGEVGTADVETAGGVGVAGDVGRTRDVDTAGDVRGDDAMTRSEEELNVGTAARERGRVRLRKYVETEQVSTTVPVQREEVRVETEPITDANRDQALAGADITESEHEVVLHEEEPVVEKRVVPKERVRLETDTVSEEREISDDVRRERIDVDESGRGTD